MYDKLSKQHGVYVHTSDLVVPKGKVLAILQDVRTGEIKKELVDNMVVNLGMYAIADHLRGTTANNRGIITYCAVGTSAVAPARTDTALGAEIARKPVSVRSWDGLKVATFQTFYTTEEAIGTLREAGLYGDDASGIPGSGQLFCHAAITRTKTINDTLTILWDVTIGA
jgi:hypothetical protein